MLVNNAAQTLTRAPGWFARASALEQRASSLLPPEAARLVLPAAALLDSAVPPAAALLRGAATHSVDAGAPGAPGGGGGAALAGEGRGDGDSSGGGESGGGGGGGGDGDGGDAAPPLSPSDVGAVLAPRTHEDAERQVSKAELALSGAELFLASHASPRDFPANRLDESRQPLDLSEVNSWSRRLGEVSTQELQP